ncbi:MAG: hypothetical protein FWF06_07375 [Symbiobacteriaceae bacterium]|nr:hypothetical protein [Symbiobacteriaceae bacterium]
MSFHLIQRMAASRGGKLVMATVVMAIVLGWKQTPVVRGAPPPGGEDPTYAVIRVDASFINKTERTANASVVINIEEFGFATRVEGEPIPYVSQIAYARVSQIPGINNPDQIVNPPASSFYGYTPMGSGKSLTVAVNDIVYESNPYSVHVVIVSFYNNQPWYSEIKSNTFTFEPEKGVPVAVHVPGASLDIFAEGFCMDPLPANQKLYFRYTQEGKKPAAWAEAKKVNVGATFFPIGNLINKRGVLELAVSPEALPKEAVGKTIYRFDNRHEMPKEKPKVEGYLNFNRQDETYYTYISGFDAEKMTFKRHTDSAYFTNALEAARFLGARILGEENLEEVTPGFYYPAGITGTILQIVVTPTYNVEEDRYTAASKPAKLAVSPEVRSPNVKPNYGRGVIPLRDALFEIYLTQTVNSVTTGAWHLISASNTDAVLKWNAELKGLELTAELYNRLLTVETQAGKHWGVILRVAPGKKPGSRPFMVPLLPKPQLVNDASAYVTLMNDKLVAVSGSTLLEHYVAGKWKRGLPKFTQGTRIETTPIRIAPSPSNAPSDRGFIEVSATGIISMGLFPSEVAPVDAPLCVSFNSSKAALNGLVATARTTQVRPFYYQNSNVSIEVAVVGVPVQSGMMRVDVVSADGEIVATTTQSNPINVVAKQGMETLMMFHFTMPGKHVANLVVRLSFVAG